MLIDIMYETKVSTPSDINEHLPVLCGLSTNKRVIEMGVRDVVSTWAFLKGTPISLISYDIYRSENIAMVTYAAIEANISFEFRQESTLECVIPECDVLFIDTWHTYDHLLAELTRHSGSVTERIVLHDTVSYAHWSEPSTHGNVTPGNFVAPNDRGLQDAVDMFLSTNNNWLLEIKYLNNNGLSVLNRI